MCVIHFVSILKGAVGIQTFDIRPVTPSHLDKHDTKVETVQSQVNLVEQDSTKSVYCTISSLLQSKVPSQSLQII